MLKWRAHYSATKRTFALLGKVGCAIGILLLSFSAYAQKEIFEPKTQRILFVLDASGSMYEGFDGTNRWEASKQLLSRLVDSLNQANPRVELALRVYGHQFHKDLKNCQDSKLEVPFGTRNAGQIKTLLTKITPQGWTPIAYSLKQSVNDFPVMEGSVNSIILITDGLETCGANLCDIAVFLDAKRITVKPFIIGLGLKPSDSKYFDCLGTYFDASSTDKFKSVLDTVISRSLTLTTAQINLLNAQGQPKETGVEISLYDHYNGALLYNFIHSLDSKGLPDTLRLDPMGSYDMHVHTIPPIIKKGIILEPGVHNNINQPCAQGNIRFKDNANGQVPLGIPILIIDEKGNTVYQQLINTESRYLVGKYKVEVLTLPRISLVVEVAADATKEIMIDKAGTLQTITDKKGIAAIFRIMDGQLEQVRDFKRINAKESVDLQPGEYILIYRWDNKKTSIHTIQTKFKIQSSSNTILTL
ncbi:hypothetical protein BH09BAC1_BH09BAC1_21440 [soil metagenome]